MSVIKNIKNKVFNNKSDDAKSKSDKSSDLDDWLNFGEEKKVGATAESTYFTCLKILSESVGKLPIHLYQVNDDGVKRANDLPIINLLKTRPNPFMTPSVFWATVEINRSHHGNSYVYIRRDGIEVKDLWIMSPDDVEVVVDDAGVFKKDNAIWYLYKDPYTQDEYVFHGDEVLHYKTSTSFDGIKGTSVRDELHLMVDAGHASQEFMTNLYEKGLSARAVLQFTSDLDDKAKTRLVKGLNKFAAGANNAGNIIPIPTGMQLTPLNLKLTDAQFVELRKLNSLQLAAAFGVKPNQLNDYSKSSYSNSEMQNLAFYTDTLLFILKQYEEENNYKLLRPSQRDDGYYFKFNASTILRTDQETQANILKGYVNNGIMRPNEARGYLDLEDDEYGNELVMNGNYIPLKHVGKQYVDEEPKGGE